MDSEQYEELCRLFIAEQLEVPVSSVQSVSIPNPTRPGLPKYKHQIDLYWETGNPMALYLNIANSKWRGGAARVDQPDVLLLQQVRQQVAAHKALMITNTGFTRGAVAAAKDHGIALHVVQPQFDVSTLPCGDRGAIQGALDVLQGRIERPLYSFHVEHRGLEVDAGRIPNAPARTGYETRDASRPVALSNRSIQTGDLRNTSFSRGGFRKK